MFYLSCATWSLFFIWFDALIYSFSNPPSLPPPLPSPLKIIPGFFFNICNICIDWSSDKNNALIKIYSTKFLALLWLYHGLHLFILINDYPCISVLIVNAFVLSKVALTVGQCCRIPLLWCTWTSTGRAHHPSLSVTAGSPPVN